MAQPSSWKDLRDRFLGALSGERGSEEAWWVIWQLIVRHPWYQAELRSCARRVLWQSQSPLAWQQEIEHDAMLVLARELQHAPDLGVDPARAEEHFAGWLGTIITRDCQQALRRLRRVYWPPNQLLPRELAAKDDVTRREEWLDIQTTLRSLNEPERTLVTLYSKGLSIRQIATQLHLDYQQVCRALQRGLVELRRRLSQ